MKLLNVKQFPNRGRFHLEKILIVKKGAPKLAVSVKHMHVLG